jgi:pimeloyl-ACP methyl ester carboxylesterase
MAWNGTRLAKLGGVRVPRSCSSARTTSSRPGLLAARRQGHPARLVLVPGGHGFFLEHAEQFNRTLLRFLKSVRST